MFEVHASAINNYNDCPRRAFTKIFYRKLFDAGIQLKSEPRNIASAVGNACHTAAEQILTAKKYTGDSGDLKQITDLSIAKFQTEAAAGVVYDDTTTNRNDAEKQIQTITRSYFHEVAPKVNPIEIEHELNAQTQGLLVCGRMDCLEITAIRDLKTGRPSNHVIQVGVYSLLSKTEGHAPETGIIDQLQRTPVNKPYPGAVEIQYNLRIAEITAFNILKRIRADLGLWIETENPNVIMCNPHSVLCNPRWCQAYNTEFCRIGCMGKEKKDIKVEVI